jgi:hypothetical protein
MLEPPDANGRAADFGYFNRYKRTCANIFGRLKYVVPLEMSSDVERVPVRSYVHDKIGEDGLENELGLHESYVSPNGAPHDKIMRPPVGENTPLHAVTSKKEISGDNSSRAWR